MDNFEDIQGAVTEFVDAFNGRADKFDSTLNDIGTRLSDLEKRDARAAGGGRPANLTWGARVANSEDYKQFVAGDCRGRTRISVRNEITSAEESAGALIAPDRVEGVVGPRRRMTVRSLLGQARTSSNAVEYFRETLFDNQAGPVAEGAPKHESDITYELASAPVRTVAHWIPATMQALEDAPQLQSLVDSTLRYGLAYQEEQQLLFGDGLGENLSGLVPNATPFDTALAPANATALDIILMAIAQAEAADLPASGLVISSFDWRMMMGLKDSTANYLSGGPFGQTAARLWQLPVVATNSMPRGEFLVGSFADAATIYDRMDPVVEISSEDGDNFRRNKLTIRAEQRLALAVRRPAALITGSFDGSATGGTGT